MRLPTRLYPYLALSLTLAAGFVVVTTFAFGHSVANAIDFGVVIGITIVSAGAYFVGKGAAERGIALVTYVVGAWAILVTAGIFSGATQRWLTFASAVAIVGLSVAGQVTDLLARERPAVRTVAEARAA